MADDDLTDAQLRARKVKPQYGEGPLVKVAWARNQAEAELIAGLLLEEGVPSVIKRNAGFDVPDFLAAGPRDVLVAASGADIARDVLAKLPTTAQPGDADAPQRPAGEDAGAPSGTPGWVRVLSITLIIVLGSASVAGAVAALLD